MGDNSKFVMCMQNEEDDRSTVAEIILRDGEEPTKDNLCRHALYQLGIRDPAIFNLQQVLAVSVKSGALEVASLLDGKDLARYVRENYMG